MAHDAYRRAGRQAELTPATESFRVVVARFPDNDPLSGAEIGQRVQLPVCQGPFTRWDGMAVGVFERLAQVGGDRLLQAGRNGMFECFRLRVHLAPIEAEDTSQEQF